ncbi:MAG: transcription elongation factor GreAB [Deltaproteobacteria bacterium]|nr:MAG: transcription elongation factor GreAB [Deltaproteobacteria bacterium]
MDKRALTTQMIAQVREAIAVAEREAAAAAEAARDGEEPAARREDARMAIEYGGLARGQQQRVKQARLMLAAIESFHPGPIARGGAIEVGAIIEIEDEETGAGRTLFLAPAGAGLELTGPDGDGFLQVVTPSSPIGKAAMGQREGDSIDVTVDGETRSWEITWVA